MSFTRTVLQATSRVQDSLEHCAPHAPRESRWIVAGLRESCTALGDLLIDPQFLQYLRYQDHVVSLEDGRRQLASYRQNVETLNRFLSLERELFVRAGLSTSVTDHLIDKIRSAIVEPREIAPSAIADGLTSLKEYVCDRFDRSATSRNRAVLGGMRDVFGGLTAAALNGGLLAVTVGLTGAASAVSIAAGSAVAADGYVAVRKLF